MGVRLFHPSALSDTSSLSSRKITLTGLPAPLALPLPCASGASSVGHTGLWSQTLLLSSAGVESFRTEGVVRLLGKISSCSRLASSSRATRYLSKMRFCISETLKPAESQHCRPSSLHRLAGVTANAELLTGHPPPLRHNGLVRSPSPSCPAYWECLSHSPSIYLHI